MTVQIVFFLVVWLGLALTSWYSAVSDNVAYNIATQKFTSPSQVHANEMLVDDDMMDYFLPLDKQEEVSQSKTLFYNRVPKCGSTSAQQATKKIKHRLMNFSTIVSHIYNERHLNSSEIQRFISALERLKKPWFYSRHIHFIDFQKYNSSLNPVYINLVRDPVNRYQSRFYFRDYMTRSMTLNTCIESKEPACTELSVENETLVYIPFFCGQDDYCLTANTKALNQAKVNIIKHYAVVGILEEFTRFLKVLEVTLPQFYTGVLQEVNPSFKNNHNYKPESISSDNRIKMMNILSMEYNLYEFIKQRFYNLVTQLKLNEN